MHGRSLCNPVYGYIEVTKQMKLYFYLSSTTMAKQDDLPCSSNTVTACFNLEESDIEGALLDEPLKAKTILQLHWWLMCHGVEPPSNEKKLH